jgi:hypothetical protein
VLKRTVRLHHIYAESVAMMEKELLIAVLAYNLVRTVMCLAARQAGVLPRQLSFTAVYTVIEIHLPQLLQASSPRRWRKEMDTLVQYAADYKRPHRSKRRSFPRAVWSTGYRFPARKQEEN